MEKTEEYQDSYIEDVAVLQFTNTTNNSSAKATLITQTDSKTKETKSYLGKDSIEIQPDRLSFSFLIKKNKQTNYKRLKYLLKELRICSITDQSFGRIDKFFVDDVTIDCNPKQSGVYFFEVTGTIYDLDPEPFKGAADNLENEVNYDLDQTKRYGLKEKFDDFIKKSSDVFSAISSSYDKIDDFIDGNLEYVDKSMDLLYNGLSTITKLNTLLLKTMGKTKSLINRALNLYQGLVNLRDIPSMLWKELDSFSQYRDAFKTDKPSPFPPEKPIFEPYIKDAESQIEEKEKERQDLVAGILNSLAFSEDLIFLFNYKFKTDEEVKEQINRLLKRISHTFLSNENKSKYRDMLEEYANEVGLLKVETVTLENTITIKNYVLRRYGNLNYYLDILKLNKIPVDFDYSGKLKVFSV